MKERRKAGIVRCLTLIVLLPAASVAGGRDLPADFVVRRGRQLLYKDEPFYAIGVNSYFLQNLIAHRDTVHVLEIFRKARQMGVTAIRTWGFFDSDDTANPAIIQWGPGEFSESGLRALDEVVAKAREYSIRLIIPLVNSWDDYGGMNQYVAWLAARQPAQLRKSAAPRQRTVTGAGLRSYRVSVAAGLKHDDFYTDTTINGWYRKYVAMLLDRVNTVTKIRYRDEPMILAWELANEPRSSDASGEIVRRWMDGMSSSIKSIDTNHLVATGEEGLEASSTPYRDLREYNNQAWLFDGTGGVSFTRDIALPNIDIAGIHLYPEDWGLSLNQGTLWLSDHQRIADAAEKPLILGEVGVRRQREMFFGAIFNEAYFSGSAGIVPWQFVYDGRPDNDGFAFSLPADSSVCGIIESYALRFGEKRLGLFSLPASTVLLNNYPNPFNQVTAISYDLSAQASVRVEVFDALGRRIIVLSDGNQLPGRHVAIFDGSQYSSGVYFVILSVNGGVSVRKIQLMK